MYSLDQSEIVWVYDEDIYKFKDELENIKFVVKKRS